VKTTNQTPPHQAGLMIAIIAFCVGF